MIDPKAKALADALRDLRDWANEYTQTGKVPTYDAIWPASKALAAYDAHPAEAATRENDDLVKELRETAKWLNETGQYIEAADTCEKAADALSRAPQPDTVTMLRIVNAAKDLIENSPFGDDDRPYASDIVGREFDTLYRELKYGGFVK